MNRKKISLVGAGNIGGILGLLSACQSLGDIQFIDISKGITIGKSLDLSHSASALGFHSHFSASDDLADIKNSDVIIVTAGLARKPGMSREDLLQKNAAIIKDIGIMIAQNSPEAFVIVVTNPLDAMVWYLQKTSNLPPQKVVGMAGILDSSRFKYFLSQELNVSCHDISTLVLGGHGDDMVPLISCTSVAGIPLDTLIQMKHISQGQINQVIERTRYAGGEIVNAMQSSAFFSPAAAAIEMTKAYLNDSHRLLPCSAYLTGHYGIQGYYIGVPVIINSKGVEKVLEIPLRDDELKMFHRSAQSVQTTVDELATLTTLN